VSDTPNPHRLGLIPEQPSFLGGRLGRHVHFDEQSRSYRVPLVKGAQVQTRTWERPLPPLDQGELGACTGNGAVGLLSTEPFRQKGVRYTEALARQVYSEATKLDSIVGAWPPKDTGSTVLAAMKAVQKLGYARNYHWCFDLQDVLKTLSILGPVELGVSWYEGFDQPSNRGIVKLRGSVRGGHAFELLGVDAEQKLVWGINSWGSNWSLAGRFAFSWEDLDRLLKEDGEAATLVI